MRPATRDLINEVAARYGVEPAVLLTRQHPKRLLGARIEIAQALHARGYNGTQIANVLRRDHSSAYFYLGRIAKKQPKVKPLSPKPEPKEHNPSPANSGQCQPAPLAPRRLVRYAGWEKC